MARGITQTDVWQACDALLLEGARPTIERVRQKIGSGSPNTVSPLLDSWFKTLGSRISEPNAFIGQIAKSPDVPRPITQIATQLWETAQVEARHDFEERLAQGMAAAIANVEAEKETSRLSAAAAFEAVSKASHLQIQLAEQAGVLEGERLASAGVAADLATAKQRAEDLKMRLERVEQSAKSERMQHQSALASAEERSDGATRRASLEIEHERQARSAADERAAKAQSKFETLQLEFSQTISHSAKATEQLRSEKRIAQLESDRLADKLAAADESTGVLADQLAAMRSRADRAEAEALLLKSVLEKLEPRLSKAPKARRRPGAGVTNAK